MGMDDKAKHKAEEAGGKVKETTGRSVGNESLETEGRDDQTQAKTKQAGDKAKDAAGDVKDAFKK